MKLKNFLESVDERFITTFNVNLAKERIFTDKGTFFALKFDSDLPIFGDGAYLKCVAIKSFCYVRNLSINTKKIAKEEIKIYFKKEQLNKIEDKDILNDPRFVSEKKNDIVWFKSNSNPVLSDVLDSTQRGNYRNLNITFKGIQDNLYVFSNV